MYDILDNVLTIISRALWMYIMVGATSPWRLSKQKMSRALRSIVHVDSWQVPTIACTDFRACPYCCNAY